MIYRGHEATISQSRDRILFFFQSLNLIIGNRTRYYFFIPREEKLAFFMCQYKFLVTIT